MADYGMRVSQPGVDVLTGTDDQMMVTSKYNNVKISSILTFTNITNSTGLWSYVNSQSHGLGYVPIILMFEKLNSGSTWYPLGDLQFNGGGDMYATSSAIVYSAPPTGSAYDAKAIVFIERAI